MVREKEFNGMDSFSMMSLDSSFGYQHNQHCIIQGVIQLYKYQKLLQKLSTAISLLTRN